ncbi:GNAT family N-acetyltransferase [Cytobacillus solani]|uniref:GNAT family N-acetyltransferase n=1 Tax=Cytobacillus solani TaxID=1637975 RepID=UPI00207A9156|nr:GNAT family N-acetyltransferase [Cytobacillus solani]USK55943.1 GNAT family N-acetyltransferase [Cytobacillus solani]
MLEFPASKGANELNSEIEIKLVSQEDEEQAHRLRDYCFPTKYTGARRDDFQYWVRHSTAIGAYDKENLIGKLLILPLNITVHGVNFKMGGMGFVATYPEYRNEGIMKKLIVRSLAEMRKNNQAISVLAPFSVSFYRHFGWELFFDKLHYTIPKESFPQFPIQSDRMKRFSFEWMDEEGYSKIQQFHNEHALKTNGGMQRDAAWWQRLARREPDSHFAYYTKGDSIAGYIRYEIKDLTFFIRDFVTDGIQAEQSLWNFISSHQASVHAIKGATSAASHFGFQFVQPQFKKEITQDVMIRIVDVYAFLKKYAWEHYEHSLYLRVQDPFAPWNECLFHISKDREIEIVKDRLIEKQHVLSLPITILSAMMGGYLSVSEALRYANHPVRKEEEENWKSALPTNPPVFYEYF